jgi:hypothetical protein
VNFPYCKAKFPQSTQNFFHHLSKFFIIFSWKFVIIFSWKFVIIFSCAISLYLVKFHYRRQNFSLKISRNYLLYILKFVTNFTKCNIIIADYIYVITLRKITKFSLYFSYLGLWLLQLSYSMNLDQRRDIKMGPDPDP